MRVGHGLHWSKNDTPVDVKYRIIQHALNKSADLLGSDKKPSRFYFIFIFIFSDFYLFSSQSMLSKSNIYLDSTTP